MRPRTFVAGVALIVMLCPGGLALTEARDRAVYGTESPITMRSHSLAGFDSPRPVSSRCVATLGRIDGISLRWRACSPPLGLGVLARLDVDSSAQLAGGLGRYVSFPVPQALPAGTALFRNCGYTECGDGEDLLLVGRKGTGTWDIRASLSGAQASGPESAGTEAKAVTLLIAAWRV